MLSVDFRTIVKVNLLQSHCIRGLQHLKQSDRREYNRFSIWKTWVGEEGRMLWGGELKEA